MTMNTKTGASSASPSSDQPDRPDSLAAICPVPLDDAGRERLRAIDAVFDEREDFYRAMNYRPRPKPWCETPTGEQVAMALAPAGSADQFADLILVQGWRLEIRSHHATLLQPGKRGKVRLETLGLNTAFWLKAVLSWHVDLASLEWGRHLPSRLWLGLTGESLSEEQSDVVSRLRHELDDNALATSMCEAVRANMDATPTEQFRALEELHGPDPFRWARLLPRTN